MPWSVVGVELRELPEPLPIEAEPDEELSEEVVLLLRRQIDPRLGLVGPEGRGPRWVIVYI